MDEHSPSPGTPAPRSATVRRETAETQIEVHLELDGSGRAEVETPLPFLDHMLTALARHGRLDLRVRAAGDIEVDPHHTIEDVGLVLGDAVRESLGERRGIARFGDATVPMDETLATCAIDLSGRPAFVWRVEGLEGRWAGGFDGALAKEFFAAFSARAACNLHFILHHGENPHHIIEALFKAFARALAAATALDPRLGGAVPSTKGTLTT